MKFALREIFYHVRYEKSTLTEHDDIPVCLCQDMGTRFPAFRGIVEASGSIPTPQLLQPRILASDSYSGIARASHGI